MRLTLCGNIFYGINKINLINILEVHEFYNHLSMRENFPTFNEGFSVGDVLFSR